MKVGEQVVISANGGRASLRMVRTRTQPDRVFVYVHNCDIETAAGPNPPLPVASLWMDNRTANGLKRML